MISSVGKYITILCVSGFLPHLCHAQFASEDGPASGASPSSSSSQQGESAFAPTTKQVQNNGLGVRILFLGRNEEEKTLSISAELQNLSDKPLYLALVGPHPAAIDTSGIAYTLKKTAGLAQCRSLDNKNIAYCFSNYGNYLPGASFSLLQPGASAVVVTTFAANQISSSGFLSVTMNVAMAKGTRPSDKRGKDTKMENVAISFPLITLKGDKE
jgi:hypothetical protein